MNESRPVVLRLEGITRRFGALVANEDVSLALCEGEVLALLGENGAGKTTLMNILFGHYVPDAGRVEAFGKELPHGSPRAAIDAGIGMVHQLFTLAANLSVLDNIMIGTEPLTRLTSARGAARRKLADLTRRFGLEVDPDARVARLSVGERQRVEILKSLYRDARLLVLDEPTAVLTPAESDRLFATLRQMAAGGLAIILISHKLEEVLRASDRIVVLRAGRVVAERPSSALNRHELAELMVGRRIVRPHREPMAAGDPVFALDHVGVAGTGGRLLLDDASFEVRAHEILGLVGVAGNGQRTVTDLAGGLARPANGIVRLFGRPVADPSPAHFVSAGVARIPEDRHAEGTIGDLALWENAVIERLGEPGFQRGGWLRRRRAVGFTERIIADYDVRCEGPYQRTRLLSGGNMQKLIIGRGLATGPRFVVANQPTRGLDEGAIAEVHGRLFDARRAGAGVLLVSEDLDEVLALADRVMVIYRGRITTPQKTETVDARRLGLLMAGHWEAADAA
jgi:simple sugar transport system ATP-binding protein